MWRQVKSASKEKWQVLGQIPPVWTFLPCLQCSLCQYWIQSTVPYIPLCACRLSPNKMTYFFMIWIYVISQHIFQRNVEQQCVCLCNVSVFCTFLHNSTQGSLALPPMAESFRSLIVLVQKVPNSTGPLD